MSNAQFPAGLIVQACERYLKARRDRIDQECEQLISRWVGAKVWFWGKPLTREQAEDYCSEELMYARITGGAWARDIEDLLTLARMAEKCNTLVTVDARLADCLKPHFG